MYKKLSEWQQARRDQFGPRLPDPRNTHGVDPEVWSKDAASPASMTADPVIELAEVRLELNEINNKIRISQDRFNGRAPGPAMAYAEYQKLMSRKTRLGRRIAQLELQCMVAKRARREASDDKHYAAAQAARATLPAVFMEMAKEMLAEEVYQRVFIAAVHRHEDRRDG